jgi:hypothetical protein
VGYLVKAGVGLALFFGGIVLFNVKLLQLLDVGTCASGNVPYEIAPGYECPEGTGTDILLLTASIFIGLIGGAVFAFRGDPPWGKRDRSFVGLFGYGTLAWGIFFAGTGATLMIATLTDESLGADSELGAKITGITFLVMGVPALLIGLWGVIKGVTGRDERPAGASTGAAGLLSQVPGLGKLGSAVSSSTQAAAPGKAGGSSVDKLERLQKLKESGALTQSEFEREKAKILAG